VRRAAGRGGAGAGVALHWIRRCPGSRGDGTLAAVRDVAIGFGLGFFVALQLGPMSLFLIRSTLRGGVRIGLAIGAGIALIDAVYAAAGAAGAAPFLAIGPLRLALGVAGAAVLLWLGVRTVVTAFRVRSGLEVAADVASPRRAFGAALAGTASNPATIASWAAIFAAAAAGTGAGAVPLVLGVGAGSATWVSILAVGVAVLRRSVGPRVERFADLVAGVALVGFAATLGWRTAQAQ
jgi:putative LysE/RhtB family amino acid efflux pump